MKSQSQIHEADLERILDRLQSCLQQENTALIIPAFLYSSIKCQQLSKYAHEVGSDNVNGHYFNLFKTMMDKFTRSDFSHVTQTQNEIIDDIVVIIQSPLFIDCLRPDIKSIRSSKFIIQEHPQRYSFNQQQKYKQKYSNKQSYNKKKSSQFNINEYDELWSSIQTAYRQHNLDKAYKISLEYIEKVSQKGHIPEDRKELINTISLEYTTMTDFYDQFDQEGWQMDKQENGITLEYKVFEKEKQIAIRINGEFEIPIVPFLAILSQIDLMGEYVPFCYDTKQLKEISRNERIGHSKIYIPLLTDRQTYFYAAGYDRFQEKGSIFLFSKTINEDQVYQHKYDFKVPTQTEYVRLEYKFFIVEYIPVGKDRAKIRLASLVDMKLNFLPLFILNKSARIFAFDYFKNILEKVKDFEGSEWQKRIQKKPDLYQFFKTKVDAYFTK